MGTYKEPDFEQRHNAAQTAKAAMLQKFRAASQDPGAAKRQAARVAMNEARLVRMAEREMASKAREGELAEQLARDAELALQAQREAEAAEALAATEKAAADAKHQVEQKLARDARYAARKAAKK